MASIQMAFMGEPELPKIVRIRKRKAYRKPGRNAPLKNESSVLIYSAEESADVDMITRWINIADRILGNGAGVRRVA